VVEIAEDVVVDLAVETEADAVEIAVVLVEVLDQVVA
jgi:hypothetical protein